MVAVPPSRRKRVQGASIDIGLPDGTWVNAIELAERVVAWWAAELTP